MTSSSSHSAAPSVREWLDSVKSGFAERFGLVFENVGIEDKSDVSHVDEAIMLKIEADLKATCGAKLMHLRRIRLAAIACGAPIGEGLPVTDEDGAEIVLGQLVLAATPSPSTPRPPAPPAAAQEDSAAVDVSEQAQSAEAPAAPAANPPTEAPSQPAIGTPQPSLSSDQVVTQQVLALRMNTDEGISQCFGFSSPAYRVSAGPLTRFAAMIREPDYKVLLTSPQAFASEVPPPPPDKAAGAGDTAADSTVERARFALLFMASDSSVGDGGASAADGAEPPPPRFCAFRWELSLQAGGEHDGCWLTDSIHSLGETPPGASPDGYLGSVPYLLPMQLKQFIV